MSKLWRKTTTVFFGLALFGTYPIAGNAAEGDHSLTNIASTAAIALQRRAAAQGYDNIEVNIRPLDSRLSLAACPKPLTVLPANSRRVLGPVSIGLRCTGPESWTLYVRGQVDAIIEMPVVATAVGRGEIVSEGDLSIQTRRISSDRVGYITQIEDIVGKEAKRSLAAGKELRFSDLKSPVLIERGQMVDIVSNTAGLRVSMQGKALSSGGDGDRVMVANLKTGKRLEGVVAHNGSVVVQ